MKKLLIPLLLALPAALVANELVDPPAPDGLRRGGTILQDNPAPPLAGERAGIHRATRNYPEQPPMIPHPIREYQVDKNFNQCLVCHSRSQSVQTGAPMVSITHYWNREGQALGAVSPRRYFCTQCHVPQHDTRAASDNRFKGIDAVFRESQDN
ncbi:nitrate reductase cytochrome c-type subunit [Marinimicrobium alkaliphilum]|uniref:nitrate reductase cytochrome c-type subunit n=1 Tax=Marinimicrobium alkaliphilum TaxID=2202654 RepID=UPI000DB979E6|nr:nitrate reductase cytochrome c-type subunit [Marinimicrobium alkaliphilum]